MSTYSNKKDHAARINSSGARIVFVGAGCPKQEIWMAGNRGRLHAVMLGIGGGVRSFLRAHQPRALVDAARGAGVAVSSADRAAALVEEIPET